MASMIFVWIDNENPKKHSSEAQKNTKMRRLKMFILQVPVSNLLFLEVILL